MKKTLTALAAAGTLAVATVATPTTADARWGWWGPAIGAFAAGGPHRGGAGKPHRPRGLRGRFLPPPRLPPPGRIHRPPYLPGRPITAMPLRPGRMSAAGAGGMGTAIACAKRLPPARADRQPDPVLRARRSAGLFFAPKRCRAVPGLTKFRQINQHDRGWLNTG